MKKRQQNKMLKGGLLEHYPSYLVMFGLMKACGIPSLKLKLVHREAGREREKN